MPSPARRISRFAFPLLLLSACSTPDDGGAGSGELSTLLLDAESYPCTLRFELTGVTLAGSVDGTTPDPGPHLGIFPDGRFVTSAPQGGAVLIWSPQGEFLHAIGREGEGPGEMGPGVYPIVGDDGTLHTIDISQMRWSRFAPDGTFLSSGTSPHFMESWISLAILGRDSLLTQAAPQPQEHQFYVVDGSGALVRSFGEPQTVPSDQRSMVLAPDRTVWIGPPYGSPTYRLEQWSLDGRLLRRIDREVEWLSRIAAAPPTGGPEEGWRGPSYPLTLLLGTTGDGLLFVTAFNRGLNDAVPGPVHIEVIDLDRPAILASHTLQPGEIFPPRLLRGPERGFAFRRKRDDLDLASNEILRYHLDPAPGASTPCP